MVQKDKLIILIKLSTVSCLQKMFLSFFFILDGSSGVYLDDPGYKCLDCDFSSPNLQALNSHLLMHRAGQTQKTVNSKQNTECDKCGESFKTVQSLDYHKTHVCIRTEW